VTVTCRETRELADPFLSDQLLVETTHEIVKHLETCPGCRDEFAARRTLRGQLQSAVASSRDLAPRPDFAAQLAANLRPAAAAAQMTRRAWLESWWAAAAALVALVGGGIFARDAVKTLAPGDACSQRGRRSSELRHQVQPARAANSARRGSQALRSRVCLADYSRCSHRSTG
jgi:anti-sigma factor RsiW